MISNRYMNKGWICENWSRTWVIMIKWHTLHVSLNLIVKWWRNVFKNQIWLSLGNFSTASSHIFILQNFRKRATILAKLWNNNFFEKDPSHKKKLRSFALELLICKIYDDHKKGESLSGPILFMHMLGLFLSFLTYILFCPFWPKFRCNRQPGGWKRERYWVHWFFSTYTTWLL